MQYVRIYADEHGETHFEDVSPTLTGEPQAGSVWALSAPLPVSAVRFRRVLREYPEEPHVAPQRLLFVHLTGEAEVEVSDGEARRFGPGSVLLAEDLAGKGHITRRVGDVVRETLVITLEG